MKIALAAILFATLPFGWFSHPKPTPVPTPSPTLAPVCASLRVQLLSPLDSSTAHVGDVFRFETIDTVALLGTITVPRNTVGYGIVAGAIAAGAHGKNGVLGLEARYLRIAGSQFDVTITTGSMSEHGQNHPIPGVVSAVPIPGLGIAATAYNYFSPGKNVMLPVGTRFDVTPVGRLDDGGPRCVR